VALLTAIGVSFILQNVARLAFSPNPRGFKKILQIADDASQSAAARFVQWYGSYSKPFGQDVSDGAVLEIHNGKMLIMLFTLFSVTVLYVLVRRTRFGKAMRATSQDLDAARLMGIDTDKVIARTFAVGGAFAGVAGLLFGLLNNVEPMMGFLPGLKAFIAAVVGGIGSIPGALIGGLVIGLAETFAVEFIDSKYKDIIAFGILIIILLFRPGGILGVEQREKV
jgi:branched-chain amino acid transport system permease protein